MQGRIQGAHTHPPTPDISDRGALLAPKEIFSCFCWDSAERVCVCVCVGMCVEEIGGTHVYVHVRSSV